MAVSKHSSRTRAKRPRKWRSDLDGAATPNTERSRRASSVATGLQLPTRKLELKDSQRLDFEVRARVLPPQLQLIFLDWMRRAVVSMQYCDASTVESLLSYAVLECDLYRTLLKNLNSRPRGRKKDSLEDWKLVALIDLHNANFGKAPSGAEIARVLVRAHKKGDTKFSRRRLSVKTIQNRIAAARRRASQATPL